MVDFGRTAQDYGRYRAGFPEAFFDRLATMGAGRPRQRVLDLGTGTGTVARGFARRGCRVFALDRSAALLKAAVRLDGEAGLTIHHAAARAEDPCFPRRTFDVVSAGQCWHWFDRPRAALQARSLLVPGGKLVIGHFDWLPLSGNVVEATEALILEHNPRWAMAGGNGVYPLWLTDVAVAGFEEIESFSFDLPAIYSHEAWRGRIRASAGIAASLSPDEVERFDDTLRELLERRFQAQPLSIPHRVFAVVCRAP